MIRRQGWRVWAGVSWVKIVTDIVYLDEDVARDAARDLWDREERPHSFEDGVLLGMIGLDSVVVYDLGDEPGR